MVALRASPLHGRLLAGPGHGAGGGPAQEESGTRGLRADPGHVGVFGILEEFGALQSFR